MLILGNTTVHAVLDGREDVVLEAVRTAYLCHGEGRTQLPHSVFLRFPDQPRDRIIGLPAFVDGQRPAAGIKWIASFPGNVASGTARASAAIILNSLETGLPEALLEGSTISARRTAASAALAAATLPGRQPDTGVSLVGTGAINAEVLRFLRVVCPDLVEVTVHDLDTSRAEAFIREHASGLSATVVPDLDSAMAAHRLVSLATTASVPHTGLTACTPGTLVLHLSLRDITPEALLGAVNVVDDADHVCRAETSLHLAERQTGGRQFIHHELPELLARGPRRRAADRVTVFSPFGLGVLDIALAAEVLSTARDRGLGVRVPDFQPA